MTREGEREIVKVEKPSGGEGYILKEALLGAEELVHIVRCSAK